MQFFVFIFDEMKQSLRIHICLNNSWVNFFSWIYCWKHYLLKTAHLHFIISNSGHYQSIQPSENNQIIRHYRWTKNRSQSRLCSVGEPIGCSSRICSNKRSYEEKECGDQSTGKRPRLTIMTHQMHLRALSHLEELLQVATYATTHLKRTL